MQNDDDADSLLDIYTLRAFRGGGRPTLVSGDTMIEHSRKHCTQADGSAAVTPPPP